VSPHNPCVAHVEISLIRGIYSTSSFAKAFPISRNIFYSANRDDLINPNVVLPEVKTKPERHQTWRYPSTGERRGKGRVSRAVPRRPDSPVAAADPASTAEEDSPPASAVSEEMNRDESTLADLSLSLALHRNVGGAMLRSVFRFVYNKNKLSLVGICQNVLKQQ